ncbi:HD domain-containing phosphohydrolase [Rheinheimera maricola]|uniref:HD domain-containing phosphohydrolase n=1 Tax=Rheinheimera maricola TaxID=2793282 RepID=UPI0019633618|nr:HD domain-containing phosphohydrolase [Rheinheimera maricola]
MDNIEQLEHFVAVGLALARQADTSQLLEQILQSAQQISAAEGGTIYRCDGTELTFATLINHRLGLHQGGTSAENPSQQPIPLQINGQANDGAVVAMAANQKCPIVIDDVYQSALVNQQKARQFDQQMGYKTQSMFTVPLLDHQTEVVGVLQLVNCLDATGQVQTFPLPVQRQVIAMASLAAMVMTNKQLVQDLENLFEALSRLLAKAIDEKSPYTGGHCRRVPALTMMLAEACSQTKSGPLADFIMTAADQHELSVAGWLHDCGKIATPEYVMDKATKLHGLHDNIELVAARFEIAARDIEFNVQLDVDSKTQQLAQLRDDMCFLREVNIGGEFMSRDLQQRVQDIAQHYQISIGGEEQSVLTAAEATNLCVARGTLNDDERRIINRHIDITIEMLESLPFPKHLKNVPEYAGGHHEKMDGTGYPRGLKKEQMSVQARIMAIADVFEALTASDRPYKKAKTLTESLRILGFMARDQHIDADLFRVFLEQKVYLQFAQQFLSPEQIDEVDITQIPGWQLSH